MTVLVRPVTLDDAEALQAHCFPRNTVEEVQSMIRDNLAGGEAGQVIQLVADAAGRAVGSATLIRNSHSLEAHRAGVYSLVVGEEYQHQGIARRLVDALAARAAALGIEILQISCRAGTAAETAYPRLGFQEFGRLPRGLKEPWGDHEVFDEVYFYRTVDGA